MTTWTDENVTRLRVMFADGASFSAIAKELGFSTRNPVVGKIKRLGLMGTGPNVPFRNATNTDWTEARERRLIEMWPDWTISANNIARELGLTRSAVSNRARRLIRDGKLQPRTRVLTGRKKPGNNALAHQIKSKKPTPVEPIAEATKPALPNAILITDLEWHHCRWPLSTVPESFCGDAREIRHQRGEAYLSPYCCAHSERAFRAT